MRYFIIAFITLLSIQLSAQEGFIRAYEINDRGTTFHNMLLVEDTLVVCGEVKILIIHNGVYFSAKWIRLAIY